MYRSGFSQNDAVRGWRESDDIHVMWVGKNGERDGTDCMYLSASFPSGNVACYSQNIAVLRTSLKTSLVKVSDTLHPLSPSPPPFLFPQEPCPPLMLSLGSLII